MKVVSLPYFHRSGYTRCFVWKQHFESNENVFYKETGIVKSNNFRKVKRSSMKELQGITGEKKVEAVSFEKLERLGMAMQLKPARIYRLPLPSLDNSSAFMAWLTMAIFLFLFRKITSNYGSMVVNQLRPRTVSSSDFSNNIFHDFRLARYIQDRQLKRVVAVSFLASWKTSLLSFLQRTVQSTLIPRRSLVIILVA